MKQPNILMKEFDYSLPEEKIAYYPLADRSSSKLLVYERGTIKGEKFNNLPEILPANSLIFFNNTKVIEARIIFNKPTGGKIEIFLLMPDGVPYETALKSELNCTWNCMIGGASKWEPGTELKKEVPLANGNLVLTATYKRKNEDDFTIEFKWNNNKLNFADVLHATGNIPLPPYIKRIPEKSDSERYQTEYAEISGSVAAPTAGLHFTGEVMKALSERNISVNYLTLHVGAGTFKPVKTEYAEEHIMHPESFLLTDKLINSLLEKNGKPIIAVGTTCMRTLESIYWIGAMIYYNKNLNKDQLTVSQWYPYNYNSGISLQQSLTAIKEWFKQFTDKSIWVETEIMIVPGYQFRVVNMLVTNFHQPSSTLLLLVAAFIGNNWRKVYEYALENEFRFLSYGDSSLLIPGTLE